MNQKIGSTDQIFEDAWKEIRRKNKEKIRIMKEDVFAITEKIDNLKDAEKLKN